MKNVDEILLETASAWKPNVQLHALPDTKTPTPPLGPASSTLPNCCQSYFSPHFLNIFERSLKPPTFSHLFSSLNLPPQPPPHPPLLNPPSLATVTNRPSSQPTLLPRTPSTQPSLPSTRTGHQREPATSTLRNDKYSTARQRARQIESKRRFKPHHPLGVSHLPSVAALPTVCASRERRLRCRWA